MNAKSGSSVKDVTWILFLIPTVFWIIFNLNFIGHFLTNFCFFLHFWNHRNPSLNLGDASILDDGQQIVKTSEDCKKFSFSNKFDCPLSFPKYSWPTH